MTVLDPTITSAAGPVFPQISQYFPSLRTGGTAVSIPGISSEYRGSALEAIAYVPDLIWGTGSVITETLLRVAARTSTGTAARILVIDRAPSYLDAVQPTSEVVNAIRTAFGLSVTDLAGVLGVERPTVYSWLKDQSTPSPARRERMALVFRFADTWTSESGGGVSPALTSSVASGIDLLSALRSPTLWEAEIIVNLRAQAAATRVHGRRSKLVAISRDRGADLRPASDFDIATGRPLSPEL